MVKTSLQTITLPLQQEGYTMKKVCHHYFFLISAHIFFQHTHPALEQNEQDHRKFKFMALINRYVTVLLSRITHLRPRASSL